MRRSLALVALGLSVLARPALAGPPFLTDDPVPTERGHWEVYGFASGSHGPDGLEGDAGLDINYGSAEDLQLTLVLPLSFEGPGYTMKGLRAGAGAIELGAKYRILHQAEAGWLPDVAVFPKVEFRTDRRFGPDHPNLQLPVWAQRDAGPWSLFGGGGFQLNPGREQKNFWFGGLAVLRSVTPRLGLGAEVFGQSADNVEGGRFVTIGLAGTWRLNKHWSLLAAGGPTWLDHGQRGAQTYLSLKFEN